MYVIQFSNIKKSAILELPMSEKIMINKNYIDFIENKTYINNLFIHYF